MVSRVAQFSMTKAERQHLSRLAEVRELLGVAA